MLNRINDPDDLETVTPLECKAHPGYYIIPGHKNYVINRNGDVIRLSDGFSPKIYTEVTGYKTVRMKVGNSKTQVRVHRLLGEVFVGRPSRHKDKSITELEINHIDGNKSNNDLDNLEWCNDYENTTHAHLSGRMDFNRTPVIARDIRTDIETTYESIAICEQAFGIKSKQLGMHLSTKSASTKTKNWHVFKKQGTVGWPTIPKDDYVENAWDMVKVWYATNPELNKTIITEDSLSLVNVIGVSDSELTRFLNVKDFNKPINGWYIEPRREHVTSENVIDVHKRVSLNGHYIKRTNVETGDALLFDNLTESCKSINFIVSKVSRCIFLKKEIGGYLFEAFKGNVPRFYPKKPWSNYSKGYEFFNVKEGIWKVVLVDYKNQNTTIPKSLYVYCTNTGEHIRHTQFLRHIDDDKTNDSFDNLKLMHKNDLVKKLIPHPDTLEVQCTHCHKVFHQPYLDVVWRRKANKGGNFYCSYKCSIEHRAITNTLSEEEQLRIKELRKEGKTIKEVSELTGYGANTILKYQEKGSNSRYYTINTRKEEMIKDFSEGMSLNKMSKKYRLSKETIRPIVKS